MTKVYLLCGKIASGKTTYAKTLCEQKNAVILSIDDVMLQLYDECLGQQRHQEVMKRINAYFFTLIPQLFKQGLNVVLDYGYWTKAERTWITSQCVLHDYPYEMHYITVQEEVRLARLQQRNEKNKTINNRQFIIQDELQRTLDARFEELEEDEYTKIIYS